MSAQSRIVFIEAEIQKLQSDNAALKREIEELRRGEGKAE